MHSIRHPKGMGCERGCVMTVLTNINCRETTEKKEKSIKRKILVLNANSLINGLCFNVVRPIFFGIDVIIVSVAPVATSEVNEMSSSNSSNRNDSCFINM